ncbi:antibiotic biosynthesis monooxygenase family protein [Ureibacillus sp. 179-F W5.1 NHS]|uniref:antibiotic biosynthesis monooxygenase family protein n=1 Tax=Ureibacillus sp. 179-F W5.1 NHS TaxID=3374297 RepID=UPI00387A4B35
MSNATTVHEPPYYAVIFTSKMGTGEDEGYGTMAEQMVALASNQKGFLGIDNVQDGKLGIMVSYWDSIEAIQQWREHTAHKVAKQKGKNEWYKGYSLKICKVEKNYSFEKE